MYVVRTGHLDSGHAAGADAQGGRGSARGVRRWQHARPEGAVSVPVRITHVHTSALHSRQKPTTPICPTYVVVVDATLP